VEARQGQAALRDGAWILRGDACAVDADREFSGVCELCEMARKDLRVFTPLKSPLLIKKNPKMDPRLIRRLILPG